MHRVRFPLSAFALLWAAMLLWSPQVGWAQSPEAPAAEGAEQAAPPKNCPTPDRVRIGAYVNNIQNLDLKTHTYEFDAYIWFKWCNPEINPAETMEFLNPSELWGLVVTPTYEAPEEFEDGTLYQVLRIQGKFNTKMPLYDYPFDLQNIGPIFEDNASDSRIMVYELDTEPVTINPDMTLPGYLLRAPVLKVGQAAYPTKFGDSRSEDKPSYARASLVVPLSRPLAAQMTLLFAPVGCVVICAALMFLLQPTLVDSRIGVGTTAMLTIVALQMTYNQELPDVGYLMLMDKIYLLSYLYVLGGLAVVMRTTPGGYKTLDGDGVGTSRRALVLFSTLYAVASIGLCWEAAANNP